MKQFRADYRRIETLYHAWTMQRDVVVVKTLLQAEKIEETIEQMKQSSFTVLDFIEAFKGLHPKDWKQLVGRFGQIGEKRRYTVTTYLSSRLDLYSRKPHSLLVPFTPFSEDRSKDYRRTTKEERKRFGSPWIAVFKKKKGGPKYE